MIIGDSFAGLKIDRLKRDFTTVGTSVGVTGTILIPIDAVHFAMGLKPETSLEELRNFVCRCDNKNAFGISCPSADLQAECASNGFLHWIAGVMVSAPSPSFGFWDFVSVAAMGVGARRWL
jgi:hypothetical protein